MTGSDERSRSALISTRLWLHAPSKRGAVNALLRLSPPFFAATAPSSKRETQNLKLRAPRARAFTLIEVLAVLAIMALIASVLIGGSTALLSQKVPSTDELFWKVVQVARKTALEGTHEVRVRVDAKERTLVLDDGDTPRLFPLSAAAGNDAAVEFFAAQTPGNATTETPPLPAGVMFYEDGTCTPFRVQIRVNGVAHMIAIDPWTCAAMLSANDPYRP